MHTLPPDVSWHGLLWLQYICLSLHAQFTLHALHIRALHFSTGALSHSFLQSSEPQQLGLKLKTLKMAGNCFLSCINWIKMRMITIHWSIKQHQQTNTYCHLCTVRHEVAGVTLVPHNEHSLMMRLEVSHFIFVQPRCELWLIPASYLQRAVFSHVQLWNKYINKRYFWMRGQSTLSCLKPAGEWKVLPFHVSDSFRLNSGVKLRWRLQVWKLQKSSVQLVTIQLQLNDILVETLVKKRKK